MNLECIIYTLLTLLIPFKRTYTALKNTDNQATRLWTHYWAIYSFITLFKCCIGFLSYQPFELMVLLFHLWLYVEEYKGALFLSALVKQNISAFGLEQHIKKIAGFLQFANVFESQSFEQDSHGKVE